MKSYEHELSVACELARAAGAAILEHYEGPLKIKQKNSDDDAEPVTQADTIANDLIVGHLKREFPNDGILAEESVDTMRRLEKSRVWMVDPLDGTNGFIDGNGAIRGEGTWIERPNFEPMRAAVSETRTISDMRLAASRSHRSPRMNKVVDRFGFKEEVQRGSVGIKIGLLIEQQCDVYIHLSSRTKQWDTCAPEVVLTEAGGRVTDLFGYPLNYNVPDVQNRNGLIASNAVSHDQIIEMLAPLLNEFGRKRVS